MYKIIHKEYKIKLKNQRIKLIQLWIKPLVCNINYLKIIRRTNKLTIAFSGALGALTMIKGFGVTIGAALGGMLGRKIGKISEGDIREKANK